MIYDGGTVWYKCTAIMQFPASLVRHPFAHPKYNVACKQRLERYLTPFLVLII